MVASDTSTPTPACLPPEGDVLSRARSENFSVASHLLPHAVRSHLMAIYGFARLADEIGDSVVGNRLAMLDWLEHELERSAMGKAEHPLFRRLTPTIVAFDLPLLPFRKLIEANRRDQRVHRYETFDELLGYCDLSAAPVGRLVLAVLEADTSERVAMADKVCCGLQVVEHLQDVAEDADRGRIYLPSEDLRRFGCSDSDLFAPQASQSLRQAIAIQVDRARELLRPGVPLALSLPPRERVAVSGFVAGGLGALDAICGASYEVLGSSPRPRRRRVLVHMARVFTGRKVA